MKKLTSKELADTLNTLFAVKEPLSPDTDLSLYIRDSIDLGELIAVLKEEYGVVPQDMELFKVHTRFEAVLKIFNHEIS
jgi:acyl carrier protein